MSKDPEQLKTLDLDRGLFIVKYKSADDEAFPPRVIVSPAPGHETNVALILHPDADQAVLWQPNSSLIVKTTKPATLHVRVLPLRRNGSRAAAVMIEPLTQGEPAALASNQSVRNPRTDTTNLSGLRLLGHVAGIGDVAVGPNEWIAGPATPSRIEGIMIDWPDRPGDLDIRYAVKSAMASAGAAKMADLGTFAGTRGRALPITSVVLEISGRGASDHQFVAEAVFLSSPILRAIGKRVVLSGPTGREPLVGLRINLESIELPEALPMPAPARKTSPSARVRVFRSRPKQGASAE